MDSSFTCCATNSYHGPPTIGLGPWAGHFILETCGPKTFPGSNGPVFCFKAMNMYSSPRLTRPFGIVMDRCSTPCPPWKHRYSRLLKGRQAGSDWLQRRRWRPGGAKELAGLGPVLPGMGGRWSAVGMCCSPSWASWAKISPPAHARPAPINLISKP